MKFDFDRCVDVFFKGLSEALANKSKSIEELHKADAISAMSFDILPWDPYMGVAFRVASDAEEYAAEPGDWQNAQFIICLDCKPLESASEYAHQVYEQAEDCGLASMEAAHLLFLAGATVLLDPRIPALLRTCGIEANALEETDSLDWQGFDYFMLDHDRTVKANYCDLVRWNRVTLRTLGRIV
jgi:hypothetical protein